MLQNSICLKDFGKYLCETEKRRPQHFVTPYELYQYKIMPFGIKNSQATLQRLVNSLISNLVGFKTYINDAVTFSEE